MNGFKTKAGVFLQTTQRVPALRTVGFNSKYKYILFRQNISQRVHDITVQNLSCNAQAVLSLSAGALCVIKN